MQNHNPEIQHSEYLSIESNDSIESETATTTHPSNEKTTWCRREGHNRICLNCGKNVKTNPTGCSSQKHWQTFERKQNYNRKYFQKHKERLVRANQHYRRTQPKAKKWMRQYGQQWYRNHRQTKLAKSRLWEKRNAEHRVPYLRQKALEWYYKHHRRAQANTKRYYAANKKQKNTRRNELLKAARKSNPGFRVLCNFRTRLSTLLRKGGAKTFSITRGVLLYTADELRAHIEKQFTIAMNWNNYGTYWEVDHIKGCAEFDLTDAEQCRTCFALENLRPLRIKPNRGRYHADRRLKSGILGESCSPYAVSKVSRPNGASEYESPRNHNGKTLPLSLPPIAQNCAKLPSFAQIPKNDVSA